MQKHIFHVAPKFLLLIAGIVWMIARLNILRIGVLDFVPFWHHNYIYVLESIAVFSTFMGLIFYRLVQKHHKRITEMENDRVPVHYFLIRKVILLCYS